MRLPWMLLAFGLVFSGLCGCAADLTSNDQDVLFEVKKGDSVASVARRMKNERIIRNPTRFQILAKLMGKDGQFKFGTYEIKKHEKYKVLIRKFASGDTYSIRLTVPEGYTIFQIAELIEKKGLGTRQEFIALCRKPENLAKAGLLPGASLEGYLYPDTYQIPMDYRASQVLDMMLNRFFEVVNSDMRAQISAKGLTLEKVLAMASIVEREARKDAEKPVIAGVYYNRLKVGMKLQADPTLIYALILAGGYDGDIRFRDFALDSKYNTYKYYGLPPAPIANPGKSAILAAIYPASVDYLYFVAKSDGTHQFSKTLQEHNAAVYQYQKLPAMERRRNRNR